MSSSTPSWWRIASWSSPIWSAARTSSLGLIVAWAGGSIRRSPGQSCARYPKAPRWRARSCGQLEPGFCSWDQQRREAQPFRSEVDGFLPLSRHRSAVLRGEVKPHSNDVRERKITLKFHSQTPSLLQDCTSRPAFSVYLRNPGSFDE